MAMLLEPVNPDLITRSVHQVGLNNLVVCVSKHMSGRDLHHLLPPHLLPPHQLRHLLLVRSDVLVNSFPGHVLVATLHSVIPQHKDVAVVQMPFAVVSFDVGIVLLV